MRILITGGAGFVGANLAIYLKDKHSDYEIICLDNLVRKGSELNLPRLRTNCIEFIKGDVRNIDDIKSVGKFDLMIECSAEPSVHAGYDGQTCYVVDTNLVGTINCLEVLKNYDANLIFLSTSRVYPIERIRTLPFEKNENRFIIPSSQAGQGWSEKGIREDFSLIGERSLYGATKYCSELLIQEYSAIYGFNHIINRFGVIAGPWQMGKVDQGFLTLWIARHMFDNKALSYNGFGGKGFQVRDVLNIYDFCSLVDKQISTISSVKKGVFNAGGGVQNSVSLKELTGKCQKLINNTLDIGSKIETADFDIPYYVTDNTLVQKTFDWEPKYSIDDTIVQVRDWINANFDELETILN